MLGGGAIGGLAAGDAGRGQLSVAARLGPFAHPRECSEFSVCAPIADTVRQGWLGPVTGIPDPTGDDASSRCFALASAQNDIRGSTAGWGTSARRSGDR